MTQSPSETQSPSDLTQPDVILIRYGELSLKGGNRREFENTLVRNVRLAVTPLSKARVERVHGRLAVFPEKRARAVAERLRDIFGIASISLAWSTGRDPQEICELAKRVFLEAEAEHETNRAAAKLPASKLTVRVRTKRADKRFPIHSREFDVYIAERIFDSERHQIQLKHPDITLGIDIRNERTYVFAERMSGPGGLPVGTVGRTLCLLSGGIDSPVAAWMTMKRGSRVDFCTFHSYPYTGDSAKKKVVDLARVLARYQPKCRLFCVPFTRVQEAIRDHAPEPYRTVLYRRMMNRIAERIAARQRAGALVTGECLGQVASQTLQNLTCIDAVVERPILRPLIGFDKEEVIELARRIGTFDTSILPEPDCCTVFQPAKPILFGNLQECEAAEAELDIEDLVAEAVRSTERIEVEL